VGENGDEDGGWLDGAYSNRKQSKDIRRSGRRIDKGSNFCEIFFFFPFSSFLFLFFIYCNKCTALLSRRKEEDEEEGKSE
jgi:hypothetical protein